MILLSNKIIISVLIFLSFVICLFMTEKQETKNNLIRLLLESLLLSPGEKLSIFK